MLEGGPGTRKLSRGSQPDILLRIIQIRDQEWTAVNSVRES